MCLLSNSYLVPPDSKHDTPGLGLPRWPNRAATQRETLHVKQISPDKGMNCHSTTAPFTVFTEPRALSSVADSPMNSAFYGVSVRRLTALLQASFPQSLAALQLPFASNYCTFNIQRVHLQGTCTPLVHAHAGRTNRLNSDRRAPVF